jgi:hypothetical protein
MKNSEAKIFDAIQSLSLSELEELPPTLLDWYSSKCVQLFVENECNRVVKESLYEMINNGDSLIEDCILEANKTEGYI